MFYILDKQERIVNVVENKGEKNSLFVYDDLHVNKIAENGTRVFLETLEFSLAGNKQDIQEIEEGFKVIYKDSENFLKMFDIYEIEESIDGVTHSKKCFAYNSLIIEMNKTIIDQPKTFSGASFEEVLAYLLAKTNWTASGYRTGRVSVEIEAKKAMAGLDKFLMEAELEIEAFVEFDGNNRIQKKILLQRRKGKDKGVRFEYKNNLKGVTRKKSNLELFTKLYVFGKTNEDGTRVNLKSVNQVVDEKGNLVNAEYVVDHQAQAQHVKSKKYAEGILFNDSIESPVELLSFANEQLAIFNHPKFEYTVELALLNESVELGETVFVIDKELNLYVSARIIEKQKSKDGTRDTVILGEFTTHVVQIPDSVWQLRAMTEKALAEARKKSWKIELSSPNGLDFQSVDEIKLIVCKVYEGNTDITSTLPPEAFKWELLRKDGTHDEEWEQSKQGIGNVIEAGLEISERTLRVSIYDDFLGEYLTFEENDLVFSGQFAGSPVKSLFKDPSTNQYFVSQVNGSDVIVSRIEENGTVLDRMTLKNTQSNGTMGGRREIDGIKLFIRFFDTVTQKFQLRKVSYQAGDVTLSQTIIMAYKTEEFTFDPVNVLFTSIESNEFKVYPQQMGEPLYKVQKRDVGIQETQTIQNAFLAFPHLYILTGAEDGGTDDAPTIYCVDIRTKSVVYRIPITYTAPTPYLNNGDVLRGILCVKGTDGINELTLVFSDNAGNKIFKVKEKKRGDF